MSNKFKISDRTDYSETGKVAFDDSDFTIVERNSDDNIRTTYKINPIQMISPKFVRIPTNSTNATLQPNTLSYLKLDDDVATRNLEIGIKNSHITCQYFRSMTLVVDRTQDPNDNAFTINFSGNNISPRTSINSDFLCNPSAVNVYYINEYCPTLFVVDCWQTSVSTEEIVFPDKN